MVYDHQKIEKKWQKIWKEKKIYHAEMVKDKTKYYILDMFPYPSGAGLHVGHVTGYTGTDIMARYKRQQGFNVLHPMGWDSFGLPAEQYAIRTGTHPAKTTEKNIQTYKRQLNSLGFSYDWDREIATSDPSYYKWTQWIFTKLFEKGLAYEALVNVNYCPELKTVLANEEVEEGRSKEGGYPVIKKALKQWVLKITAYADRLIEDLEDLDWPENLKRLQINWIGKSVGAKIHFIEEKTKVPITVFTTRPDTIFGSTYLVLSPEHPLVPKITTKDRKELVTQYLEKSANESDIERMDQTREKTGEFTGAYAIHPTTNEKIPIYIADYVLMSYATGSIMAVPAHDERDFEFAKKFDLPIKPVYEPDSFLIDQEELSKITKQQYLEECLEGKRCWTKSGKVINSSSEMLSLNGLSLNEAIEKATTHIEKEKLGEKAVSYKLRDWLFSRQRYWGEPFPIYHFEDGTKRVLDLDELPLTPPDMKDFHPSEGGLSPLAKVDKWVNVDDPKTNKKAKREVNTMPQWAGSCWYYLRFVDPKNRDKAWGEEEEKYWMPVDLYVGGTEHAVLHLLYARFWHKVLYDIGAVSTKEPFKKYRNQGLVTAPSYKRKQGGYVSPEEVIKKEGKYYYSKTKEELTFQIEKMSKSKLNGVTPDEMVEEFGADTLRLYEMFMGPFDKEKIWNMEASTGCYRFLNRFFEMATSEKVSEDDSFEGMQLSHRLCDAVMNDIEQMQFNTAIARLMEFINSFTKLKSYPKKALIMATQMLYPLAPHIAEEIWEKLGQKEELSFASLPKVEQKYLVDTSKTYVVQINGKVRGRFDLPVDAKEEEVVASAKKDPNVQKYLDQKEVIKTIFVPGKLLNIVVKN